MWHASPAPLAAEESASQAGHLGGEARFVDKDQLCWIKVQLTIEPVLSSLQDVWAILLQRMGGLFCT